MSPLEITLVCLLVVVFPFAVSSGFVVTSRSVGRFLARSERPDPPTLDLLAQVARPSLPARLLWTLAEGWFQIRAGLAQLTWLVGLLPKVHGPAGGPVVIILPGYLENGGKMSWLGRRLGDDGFRVHLLDFPSTTLPVHQNASWLVDQLACIRKEEGVESVHIVGHSMGGVVARRAALSDCDGVARVICIASPHRGTHLARLSFHASARDMRPALDGDDQRCRVPVDGVMSLADNIVQPPWSFATHEGEMMVLPEPVGHIAPLYMSSVHAFVRERLSVGDD